MDYLDGPDVITIIWIWERGKQEIEENGVVWGCKPRNAGFSRSREMGSPLETPEGTQPRRHLDFSQMIHFRYVTSRNSR